MEIGELFGTLQQSIITSWRDHLDTHRYSVHMALDEYYKEMPELIDSLIEDWIGINGEVEKYTNILDEEDFDSPVEYLKRLKDIVSDGYDLIKDEEIESDLDNVACQIDSTLYKLKELTESSRIDYEPIDESEEFEDRMKGLSEFLREHIY